MKPPFSAEEFLSVFAEYNQAVWPVQPVLYGVAFACVTLLFRPEPWASRLISLLLTGLWLWVSLAFHLAFFAPIAPMAWWFGVLFLVGAMTFDWYGVVNDKLRFAVSNSPWGLTGAALMLFAVLYPIFGYAIGRSPLQVQTVGLPSPTTIFTVGLLLLARAPTPRLVLVVPVLWLLIAASGAVWLDIREDVVLIAAAMVGLAAMVQSNTQLPVASNAPRRART